MRKQASGVATGKCQHPPHYETPWRRAVIHAVCLAFSTLPVSTAANADDPLAPCNEVAGYLRSYAQAHPEFATSDKSFPVQLLTNQANDATIQFLPSSEGFADLDGAVASLAPIKIDDVARDFIDSIGLNDLMAGSYWWVIDGRQFGDRAAIYRIAGSAYCFFPAIFDTSNGKLVPAYSGRVGEGEACDGFGTDFELLRIGNLAYPALSSGENPEIAYVYHLGILPRSGVDVRGEAQQCHVEINFSEVSNLTDWKLADRPEDHKLAKHLRTLLLPLEATLRKGEALDSLLRDFLGKPISVNEPNSFQRLASRNDPNVRVDLSQAREDDLALAKELPTDEWGIDGHYLALEIDGQKIILANGERAMGWHTSGYNSLAAWKWVDQGAVPLLSADFLIRGSKPEIIVSAP